MTSSVVDSMCHPQIVARDDGKYVVEFEGAIVEKGASTIQRFVDATILDLNAHAIPAAIPNPLALEVVRQGRDSIVFFLQTEAGRTYQLMTGLNVKAL